MLSHIPIEVEWLVLSVNQERTQKRQRHLPSVVTDSFAHEINNAFTYCQVGLSSLGFRVSSVIKQTRSFGQPVSGGSKQLTETHWAQCWPSTLSWVEESCEPMPHQIPTTSWGRWPWLEELPEPGKGTLCDSPCAVAWAGKYFTGKLMWLASPQPWFIDRKDDFINRPQKVHFELKKNPHWVHSMSLTELITFGVCSYSAEILNNRPMAMDSLTVMILR